MSSSPFFEPFSADFPAASREYSGTHADATIPDVWREVLFVFPYCPIHVSAMEWLEERTCCCPCAASLTQNNIGNFTCTGPDVARSLDGHRVANRGTVAPGGGTVSCATFRFGAGERRTPRYS